jgi:hypothetical protein
VHRNKRVHAKILTLVTTTNSSSGDTEQFEPPKLIFRALNTLFKMQGIDYDLSRKGEQPRKLGKFRVTNGNGLSDIYKIAE